MVKLLHESVLGLCLYHAGLGQFIPWNRVAHTHAHANVSLIIDQKMELILIDERQQYFPTLHFANTCCCRTIPKYLGLLKIPRWKFLLAILCWLACDLFHKDVSINKPFAKQIGHQIKTHCWSSDLWIPILILFPRRRNTTWKQSEHLILITNNSLKNYDTDAQLGVTLNLSESTLQKCCLFVCHLCWTDFNSKVKGKLLMIILSLQMFACIWFLCLVCCWQAHR